MAASHHHFFSAQPIRGGVSVVSSSTESPATSTTEPPITTTTEPPATSTTEPDTIDITVAGLLQKVTGAASIQQSLTADIAGLLQKVAGAASVQFANYATITGTLKAMTGGGFVLSNDPYAILTTDHTKVGASDLTNFVQRVDLSDISDDTFWDTVIPGGGNLRVFNAAGSTEYPVDVVHCDTYNRTGYFFFKASLSHTTDDVFHVRAKIGGTMPATTDTYGRNNVWSDYNVVILGGFIGTNRTGGTNPSVPGGTTAHRRVFDDIAAIGPDTACQQGVATDGTYIYMSGTNTLKKYSAGFASTLLTDSDPLASAGLSSPYNHIGDGCIVGGEWILPAAEYPETGGLNQTIVVFNTSDLSFNRKVNISGLGISDCSSICYISDLGLYCLASYTDSTHLYLLDSSFALVQTITLLTAITNIQGIDYYNGQLYISSDNVGLWIVSLDGGDFHQVRDSGDYTEMEGIASKGDGTFYLLDNGGSGQRKVHTVGLAPGAMGIDCAVIPGNTTFGDDTRTVGGITKPTQWSMGALVFADVLSGANKAILEFGDEVSGDTTREGINYHNATSRWGVWNSTDTWLDDPGSAPSIHTVYRLDEVFNGTTNRKLFKDGVLVATDTGVSQRPTGTGTVTLFICVQDLTISDIWDGSITDIYLRSSLLSDDWKSAEYHSWYTGDMYTIT